MLFILKTKFLLKKKRENLQRLCLKSFWIAERIGCHLIESEYKGSVAVARESLDKIPVDAADIPQIQNRSYHVSCYQLFTNLSKLERAKNCKPQQNESVAEPLQSLNHPLLQHCY